MRETGRTGYSKQIKQKLKEDFPECKVFRLDPNEVQGIPDLVMLCPVTWATLETKGFEKANIQPNQPYYVKQHNEMSFSSFIHPDIEEAVLNNLHKHVDSFKNKKENKNDI